MSEISQNSEDDKPHIPHSSQPPGLSDSLDSSGKPETRESSTPEPSGNLHLPKKGDAARLSVGHEKTHPISSGDAAKPNKGPSAVNLPPQRPTWVGQDLSSPCREISGSMSKYRFPELVADDPKKAPTKICELFSQRLLVVYSEEFSVAMAAGHQMAHRLAGSPLWPTIKQVHQITLNAAAMDIDALKGRTLTIGQLIKEPGWTGGHKECVFVIDCQSEQFANSLCDKTLAQSDSWLKEDRDVCFIVTVDLSCIDPDRIPKNEVQFWELEPERPYLVANFPNEVFKAGGERFFEELRSWMYPNGEGAERRSWLEVQRILKGRDFARLLEAVNSIRSAAPVVPQEVPEFAGPCERAACFAATFFRGMGLHSFRRVVAIALGDEVITFQERGKETEVDGKRSVEFTTKERLARDVWFELSDSIRGKCGIRLMSGSKEEKVVAFMSDTVAAQFRELFLDLEGGAAQNYFERLVRAGVMIAPESPPDIVRGFVELTGDMVRLDSGRFGDRWLLDVVGGVHFAVFNEMADVSNPEGWLERLFEEVSGSLFSRLDMLCRHLLRSGETTQRVVKSFLSLLVSHHGLNKAALRLLRRLQGADGLERDEWFRRLLENGSDEVRCKVHDALLDEVSKSLEGGKPLIQRLWAWPDNSSTEVDHLPKSKLHALGLIEAISLEEWNNFLIVRGKIPFFLLEETSEEAVISEEVKNTPTPLYSILANWLMHPAYPAGWAVVTRDRWAQHGFDLGASPTNFSELTEEVAGLLILWETMSRPEGKARGTAATRIRLLLYRSILKSCGRKALLELKQRIRAYAVGLEDATRFITRGKQHDTTLAIERRKVALELNAELSDFIESPNEKSP